MRLVAITDDANIIEFNNKGTCELNENIKLRLAQELLKLYSTEQLAIDREFIIYESKSQTQLLPKFKIKLDSHKLGKRFDRACGIIEFESEKYIFDILVVARLFKTSVSLSIDKLINQG